MMINRDELICRVINRLGEKISGVDYDDEKIYFKESIDGELYISDIKTVLDEDEYKSITYEGFNCDVVVVDINTSPSIDNAFKELKKAYVDADPLISMKKESDKITIVVERGKGWGLPTVQNAIGSSDYDVADGTDSNGDYIMIITVKNIFNISKASANGIKEQLGDSGVRYVAIEDNDTITIHSSKYVPMGWIRNRLNLPESVIICPYMCGKNYMYVINEAQIREAIE